MRILYIITQGENGGAQKNVFDSASAISDSGHEVFVVTGQQENKNDQWLFGKLKEFGFSKEKLSVCEYLARDISLSKDIRALIDLYRYITNNRFHIIHLHSTKAGVLGAVAGKLAGSRIIYTVHGFVFQEPLSVIKKLFYITVEFCSSFFIDAYICVSEKDLDIGRKYKIIRKNKGVVIYNGIQKDYTLYTREESRDKILSLTRVNFVPKKIIGTVANLYKTKGLEYLVEAASLMVKQNPHYLFVVFGEGELRSELQKKITSLGLDENFKLVGFIDNASRLLRGLDVLVLPSVKEGLPYILIEASRAQIPIVATHVGGVVEMSKLISMNLVNPKDGNELASKINDVFSGKAISSSEFNPKFSIDAMTESIYSQYETLNKGEIVGIQTKSPFYLITLPALNEEMTIEKTLYKIAEYLEANYKHLLNEKRISLCVAINGSTDNTRSIVEKNMTHINFLRYTFFETPGRGNALYNTWKDAEEDIFIYTDSDLAYSVHDLGGMLDSYEQKENYDMVVGSRRVNDSVVIRHPLRKFLTEGYNILTYSLFAHQFTDAQAGHKSITKKAFARISENVKNYKGWFFDTALLLYAEKKGFKIKDLKITCVDNRK
jgi:glycosyltransferase involved in cell wall biosynthesis